MKRYHSRIILVLIILNLLSCSSDQPNQQDENNNVGDAISNAFTDAIGTSEKSCDVNFSGPYAQEAIYSEFKNKDESFVGIAKEFEKIFTYSSETLNILSTANFNSDVTACILDNSKFIIADSANECSEMRSKTSDDGSLVYNNVKTVENIKTRFREYIVLSESNDSGNLTCQIKFVVEQKSSSNAAFERATPWIDLTLYIYDQKISTGDYYSEYLFPGLRQYSQSNQNQTFSQPVRGRDLRTNTTGTGVRE